MAQNLKRIIAAPVAKIGKFSLGTVGSLSHGGPYVAVTLKGDRVGWISFKTRQLNPYEPKHKDFNDAKEVVDIWMMNNHNFNIAATAWNSMNLGVYVQLVED